MPCSAEAPHPAPGPVVIGDDPDVLARTLDPVVALAVWRRRTDAVAAVAGFDLDAVDDVHAMIGSDDAETAARLAAAGYPPEASAILGQDVSALARRFAAIIGAARLAVRLEVVETNACRRFHADYVTRRLLCTYRGPGTQWCLGDGGPVQAVPTGAVAIFTGRALIDPPVLLHRSPPIAGSGVGRLVLVLDPA